MLCFLWLSQAVGELPSIVGARHLVTVSASVPVAILLLRAFILVLNRAFGALVIDGHGHHFCLEGH